MNGRQKEGRDLALKARRVVSGCLTGDNQESDPVIDDDECSARVRALRVIVWARKRGEGRRPAQDEVRRQSIPVFAEPLEYGRSASR